MIKSIILSLSIAIASLLLPSSKADGTDAVTIPFLLERNCIYIHCTVNGTDSLKFLFDTGADGSVLTQHALSKVNVTLDGNSLNVGSNGQMTVQMTSNNVLTMGSVTRNNQPFTIIDYGESPFDGVLGTDVMQDHFIEIDYTVNCLVFHTVLPSINTAHYKKVKMHTGIYPTYIKGKISVAGKEHKGYFGIDTGADDALTMASPFAAKHHMATHCTHIGEAAFVGSDGSVNVQPIVLSDELQMADHHFYLVPTSLSKAVEGIDATKDLAGFYGNNFLKRFNLLLDYKNKYIYFKPNHLLYTPFF